MQAAPAGTFPHQQDCEIPDAPLAQVDDLEAMEENISTSTLSANSNVEIK